MRKTVYLCAAAMGALALAAPAHAQNTEAQISGDDPSVSNEAGDNRDSNAIIVTATKRQTTLAETPIAVSVVDKDTIEQAQIRDLLDLQSVVPSLSVSQNQTATQTTFLIRGFGNGANNPGIEPSVAVFIDGVYRSRSAAQIADLPNVERVEVLRGPQSTLFGKNASAGVISIITQEPKFKFGGSASLTYGNYNTVVAKADVTGPISDTLAFDLSGGYDRRDGYVHVINLDRDINDRDRWNVRGQLLFKPNDALKVRLIGDYSKISELCCAAPNVRYGPTGPALNAVAGQVAVVPEDPFSDTIKLNRVPTNEIENYGGSAQVDYSFGDLSLTSITAYRQLRATTEDDGEFTVADIFSNRLETNIDTFTQELRLTSNFDGPLNFLLGGFYFDENIDYSNDLAFGPAARPYLNILGQGGLSAVEGILGLPVGQVFFAPGTGINDHFDFSDKSYSVFGTVDFKVTSQLTLTAGLNYTHDKKAVVSNIISTEPFSAIDLVALGVAIGVPATVANTAANPLIGLKALQFLPPFLNIPNAVEDGRTRDSDLSYTLRAAYELNRHINFYATYATGFKASSFNLSRDSRPLPSDFIPGSSASVPAPPSSPIRDAGLALPNLTTGTRFAGPENSEVYEIGIKGNFPRVTFNLSLFDQTFDGFQSNVFTGTGFVLANASKLKSRGFEFDGTVTPVDPLTIFLAVTYNNAKFGNFPNSAVGDLSNERIAGIPPISMSAGASFTRQFEGGQTLILRGDYQHESETDINDGLPGFITYPGGVPNFTAARAVGRQYKRGVDQINASATLRLNENLELSIYARNLTNDRFLTTIFDGVAQTGSIYGYPNQPRTYGGTIRYKF